MNIPTPNCRQLIPVKGPTDLPKFKLHRSTDAAPVAPSVRKPRGAESPTQIGDASHAHLPSEKDCFGCVDWFQF
jgi:hypothetical protein